VPPSTPKPTSNQTNTNPDPNRVVNAASPGEITSLDDGTPNVSPKPKPIPTQGSPSLTPIPESTERERVFSTIPPSTSSSEFSTTPQISQNSIAVPIPAAGCTAICLDTVFVQKVEPVLRQAVVEGSLRLVETLQTNGPAFVRTTVSVVSLVIATTAKVVLRTIPVIGGAVTVYLIYDLINEAITQPGIEQLQKTALIEYCASSQTFNPDCGFTNWKVVYNVTIDYPSIPEVEYNLCGACQLRTEFVDNRTRVYGRRYIGEPEFPVWNQPTSYTKKIYSEDFPPALWKEASQETRNAAIDRYISLHDARSIVQDLLEPQTSIPAPTLQERERWIIIPDFLNPDVALPDTLTFAPPAGLPATAYPELPVIPTIIPDPTPTPAPTPTPPVPTPLPVPTPNPTPTPTPTPLPIPTPFPTPFPTPPQPTPVPEPTPTPVPPTPTPTPTPTPFETIKPQFLDILVSPGLVGSGTLGFGTTVIHNPINLSIFDGGTRVDGDQVEVLLNGVVIAGGAGIPLPPKSGAIKVKVFCEEGAAVGIPLPAAVGAIRVPFKLGANKLTVRALNVGSVMPNTSIIQLDNNDVLKGEPIRFLAGASSGSAIDYYFGFPQIGFPAATYPESAQHVLDAWAGAPMSIPLNGNTAPTVTRSYPHLLTLQRGVDINGLTPVQRGRKSTAQYRPRGCPPNYEADEYPPKIFEENFGTAHIKCILGTDNSGSGGTFANTNPSGFNNYRFTGDVIPNDSVVEFVLK